MLSKMKITGIIEVKTGMHIGGSAQFAAIGAVDSPIVRDPLSNKSMIPGSSLKGKMRSLLARAYDNGNLLRDHNDDAPEILRLFGNTKDAKKPKRSRLIFSDMVLANDDKLKEMGIFSASEIKFENTINRLTAGATPRQIERAIRGSEYELELIYDAENKEEIIEDFTTISDGFKLLQLDYLGGNGSRGYGRVIFKDLEVDAVIGEVDSQTLEECKQLLKGVC